MASQKFDNRTSVELLKAYTQNALASKSNRTSTSTYNSLVEQVSSLAKQRATNDNASATFVKLLQALCQCVSLVHERDHESLLAALFSVNLWTCHAQTSPALLEFAASLVSFNGALVNIVLHFLVGNFVPTSDAQAAAMAGGPGRSDEVMRGVHSAVDKILRLVPTAGSRLLPIIVQQWPHKRKDQYILCTYLQNVFRAMDGAGGEALFEPLLGSVVDKLIEIDVEIRWEDIADIPVYDEDEDNGEEGVFELDELEIVNHEEVQHGFFGAGSPPAGGAGGRGQQEKPCVDETADKLDSMMELTFQFLEHKCAGGGSRRVFDALLQSFERTLLHTHRSKFTQYLLFFVASRDTRHDCARAFTSFLGERLLSPALPANSRLAAAAYLASFLARASFVPLDVTVSALHIICQWCLTYAGEARPLAKTASVGVMTIDSSALRRTSSVPAMPSSQEHVVFYGAAQAVMYVLCYRMGAVARAPGTLGAQLRQLPVQALLETPLAPLAGVLSTIAQEFAAQCAALDVFGGEAVVRAAGGAGDSGPAAGGGGGALGEHVEGGTYGGGGGTGRTLEMFFPFDPYLLRRSSRFLELRKSYTTWRAASRLAHGDSGPVGSASHQESGGGEDDDGDSGDEATSGDSSDSFEEDNERMSSVDGTPVSHPSSVHHGSGSYGGSYGVTPPRFGAPKGPAFGFGRPLPISAAAAQLGASQLGTSYGTPMSCTPEGYLGRS